MSKFVEIETSDGSIIILNIDVIFIMVEATYVVRFSPDDSFKLKPKSFGNLKKRLDVYNAKGWH